MHGSLHRRTILAGTGPFDSGATLKKHIAILFVCLVSQTLSMAVDVPLWGKLDLEIDYEIEAGLPHAYADPFFGVWMNADFTSPSGRLVNWWGFHDGDGVGGQDGQKWRIRFMCDEPGAWSYVWALDRHDAGQIAGAGTFECVNLGAKPGPLQHDPTINQWLRSADGSRYVTLNMYARGWNGYRRDIYRQPTTTIADIKSRGFDVVFSSGPIHHIHGGIDLQEPGWPQDGDNPWIYTEVSDWPNGPVTFTPRLQGWHMYEEGLLETMYDDSMYLFEFYGFYGGNDLFTLHKKPVALQDSVIKYYIVRTAPYWFMTYNIGFELGDFACSAVGSETCVPDWPLERMGYVKSIDPWDHIIVGHENNGVGFSYGGATPEAIDFSALQIGDNFHSDTVNTWKSSPQPHPHCSECIWNSPAQGEGEEASHRRDLWQIVTGGGSATFYDYYESDIGLAAFENANLFLDSDVGWYRTEPRDDLLSQGGGHVLAADGDTYIVYVCSQSQGCGGTIRLDLEAGEYRWRWFELASGTFEPWATLSGWNGGDILFAKPDSGDWVLHVASMSFCGNGTVDGNEQCDPAFPVDFGGKTCASEIGVGSVGTLDCIEAGASQACTFETADCSLPDPCAGSDADGDGVCDAVDNCLTVKNGSQTDLDNDSAGDECDLDDGTLYLWVENADSVKWQEEFAFELWNLYRGDLATLRSTGVHIQAPGSNPLAERWCGLTPASVFDPWSPEAGQAAFYLVTGVSAGVESALGGGRSNANPCP